MKGLGNNKPDEKEKRIDFGEALISNCKYDCTQCLLKAEGCVFVVNSIRCDVAHHRLKKILEEDQNNVKDNEDEENEDASLVEDEKKSMADYLKNLSTEGEENEDSE